MKNAAKKVGQILVAKILPGFLVDILVFGGRLPARFIRVPGVLAQTVRKHPLQMLAVVSFLAAGVFAGAWGALHLKSPPPRDVILYNESLEESLRISRLPDSVYCYEEEFYGGYPGGVECISEETLKEVRAGQRATNLSFVSRFAEVSLNAEDRRIASRALYNIGTLYLADAIDFQDVRSLDDAILNLQNALRNDFSYDDRLTEEGAEIAVDKRINLEIALLLRAMREQGMGAADSDGDGEAEENDGPPGFGAGRSDPSRKP